MGLVRHMVICRFKEGTTTEKANDLLSLILKMKGRIPGIVGIEAGPYESPEGMNAGYTHGFLVTFESPAARDVYLPHPEHVVVRDALLPHIDSVIAFDFEVRT
jgi:hypothetical protein